jgi:asparagine synthase (glutamine-hydrolysing)
MCGVLGLVSGNKEINRDQFQTALKKQEYRGPDSSKIIEVGKGLFGFNRLTIQDLSDASMQPFEYKGNWLVFNGEIYNWKELRKDLEQQGFIFKTHGDTEVLCIGLSEEGLDFIKKLNGIFAFCFYDKVNEVYTIARDLMGVKPLYYSQTPSGLVISSDVSSILEFLPNKEINMDTIYSHLFFDWFTD